MVLDGPSHIGYQQWHRQYDNEVKRWLERNPNATQEGFLQFLIDMYSTDEMRQQFPVAVESLMDMLP
jgi:hypothetical protein